MLLLSVTHHGGFLLCLMVMGSIDQRSRGREEDLQHLVLLYCELVLVFVCITSSILEATFPCWTFPIL